MTPPPSTPDCGDALIIVTGLPHSGTSLVMSLLAAGGHPILTDHLRPADPDNPRGYFEYAPVKSLMRDSTWLQAQRGQAIKIISTLLPFIPPELPLKVIVIERNLVEVLASQAAMLTRSGKPAPAHPALLSAAFQKQIATTQSFLAHRPRTAVLTLQHHDLIQSPAPAIARLIQFLPSLENPGAMLQAIDPSLHRQHGTTLPEPQPDPLPTQPFTGP